MTNKRIWTKGTDEYKKLETVAKILTALTDKEHEVDNTYFDFGQGWKWTTIIIGDCQLLYPREYEEILSATTKEELVNLSLALIKNHTFIYEQ